ncbi:MAG: hypothetical protein MI922_17395 [Bacteroidales bacterium]|nr:hypothetical protein [Bacteroidales bacterium]
MSSSSFIIKSKYLTIALMTSVLGFTLFFILYHIYLKIHPVKFTTVSSQLTWFGAVLKSTCIVFLNMPGKQSHKLNLKNVVALFLFIGTLITELIIVYINYGESIQQLLKSATGVFMMFFLIVNLVLPTLILLSKNLVKDHNQKYNQFLRSLYYVAWGVAIYSFYLI